MNYIFTIYSILFLVTSLVSFFGAFLAWQRRSVKAARELTRLIIAAGIWTFFIMFETASATAELKIFWSKLAYLGAVTTPVFYMIFVLRFTGKEKFITISRVLFLFVVPLISLLIAFTNEKHLLLWSGFSPISSETNMMEYYHGIWFWIGYMGYNNLLLLLATYFLISFIIHHKQTFRRQGIVVYIAGFCPWVAGILYVTGLNPVPGLDLVPVSMILSASIFIYALIYTYLLDLVPIARETLVETLSDGMLVIDGQNRVQDINRAALKFLEIQNKNILGFPLELSGAKDDRLLSGVINTENDLQLEIQQKNKIKIFKINKQPIKNQPHSRLIIIRDITDKIESQHEIRMGEQRYQSMSAMFRLMADNMSDMLWAKDLNNRYIFTNKAMCDNLLHASDTDEPIGKTDMFFAERERMKHPDRSDWHTFGELCQDSDRVVIESGKAERFDEYGNVSGKFLFLDARKAPIYDENGKMVGVVGSAHDITLQKVAESEIIKRDILLDAISKATAVLIQGENLEVSILKTLEIIGKATMANRVYIFQNHSSNENDTVYTSQRHEWTDGTVEALIHDPELQNISYTDILPRWFENLSAGKVITGIVKDFPETERALLVPQEIKSILVAPVFINKTFWGFIGFDDCLNERIWPLTEERILAAAANTIGAAYQRKKDQEELIIAKDKAEETEQKLLAFINSIPDIICYKDKDGRWLLANDADLELFCLKNVDYFGKTDAELASYTHEIYKDAFINCMKSDEVSWLNGTLTKGIEIVTTNTGERKFYEVLKKPLFYPNGQRKALAVIGREITELIRTQHELENAKLKAEESDRLKSAFLANMSHEIRTPMNGILGFAELLKEPGLTGEELKNYIYIIEKSGARMLNIINNIVDISKIESGQMELSLSKTNINKQIEYIYTFFRPEAETKGIEFTFVTDLPTDKVNLTTDREKLYAILTNLVKNAIKYTNQGHIKFGYKFKKAGSGKSISDSVLEFYVKDSGIGVAEDRQIAIFERFIQADILDKQALQGAGLGLSITKAYIEMLGGKIWMESKPGQGSTFYFTMPYNCEEEEPVILSSITNNFSEKDRKLKILVVEDESTSDLYITLALQKISREFLHAKTGMEAVEACRNNPDLDLVLMDIKMPEMNGYEATRQIREFNKDILIIAQTAYGLTGDREKAISAGCNDYLSKPVKIQEITVMLDKYLKT